MAVAACKFPQELKSACEAAVIQHQEPEASESDSAVERADGGAVNAKKLSGHMKYKSGIMGVGRKTWM